MATDGALLELHEVVAGYEEVEVLRGVSLAVRAGEVVCIIGANGAGKSTLLRTVFGMVRPRGGSIRFAGEEVAGRPSTEVLRRGIGYVPQGRCNFPFMTVLENLEMGYFVVRDRREVRRRVEAVLQRFPLLSPRRRQIFEDPTFGWDAVAADGVEVHTVPGSHQTIIEAPHVEILAEVLGACLARAEGALVAG